MCTTMPAKSVGKLCFFCQCIIQGWRQMGVSAPSSGKNFTPVGEFLTQNCVLILTKIPSILLYSPLSENLAPRRANPGATSGILLLPLYTMYMHPPPPLYNIDMEMEINGNDSFQSASEGFGHVLPSAQNCFRGRGWDCLHCMLQ